MIVDGFDFGDFREQVDISAGLSVSVK